ncbi:hypothetical protein BJF90_36000 [Pseudonocardia sp. CNS-004]|nr:hypothetical protein BJF90_36000 [Pseudonocardia sp. CNS-004]
MIRGTDGFDAGHVEDIEIVVDPNRMPHTDRPVLTEALSGKFSLQYVASRALLSGTVALSDFDGDAHRDPATIALMSRVRVLPAPPGGTPNSFSATVRVTQTDGSEFTATSDPHLSDNETTVDPPVLWEKFADCAGRVLPAERVAALSDALRGFPAAGTSVRELVRLAEVDTQTHGTEVTS